MAVSLVATTSRARTARHNNSGQVFRLVLLALACTLAAVFSQLPTANAASAPISDARHVVRRSAASQSEQTNPDRPNSSPTMAVTGQVCTHCTFCSSMVALVCMCVRVGVMRA